MARRRWTAQDEWLLDDLLYLGLSYTRIARRLNRSRNAIILKCQRRGTLLTNIPTVLTCVQVAQLLGLSCSKIVAGWINRGWLKACNAAQVPRVIWRIQKLDLLDMLAQPSTWMAWSPESITDPELQQWATELRAGQSPWLSVGEVAKRYHVAATTVNQWIARGVLLAVRYGNWWVRSADLDHFIPPCERPRSARDEAFASLSMHSSTSAQ